MSTDLERRLVDAFHEDAQRARLVNTDRPADRRRPQPVRTIPRVGPRPWLVAAAAATVLIVAGAALLLRTARDGAPEENPVDLPANPVLPAIPVPLWVDLPAGSTVALPQAPVGGLDGGGGIWTGTEQIVWGEPAARKRVRLLWVPRSTPGPAGGGPSPQVPSPAAPLLLGRATR